MELTNLIASYVMQYISPTATVVFIATGLSMFLPTKLSTKKDTALVTVTNGVLKLLNIVAGNILRNKNADSK